MKSKLDTKVAVLLATYNGTRFIEPQIRSLKENTTPFILHWLDDHSSDGTREAVRAAAQSSGIEFSEWHQPQRQGIPGAYFQLLECVDADIYLFCDQDDIWQPGKIDVTAEALQSDLSLPVLCFSEPLVFSGNEPEVLRSLHDVAGVKMAVVLQESRVFMCTPALGNTMGFTRALRDLFFAHRSIARTHAIMHDCWMYIIAHASGTPRMLSSVPTTLYRRHENNLTAATYKAITAKLFKIPQMWRLQQLHRFALARQAKGFVLSSATLPPGPKLDRLLAIARLLEALDRRQSLAEIVRLARLGAIYPDRDFAISLALACLCSAAKA